jgi:hypothetical protein
MPGRSLSVYFKVREQDPILGHRTRRPFALGGAWKVAPRSLAGIGRSCCALTLTKAIENSEGMK